MKTVKIKKRYYSDLSFMYKDLGLINEKNECNPSNVLMSKEDLKILKKTTENLFKKQYPGILKRRLDAGVAMHLLNLSPSERAKEAIKPGYMIILDV